MKYVVTLVLGMIFGAVLFALALIHNPFSGDRRLSPLTDGFGGFWDFREGKRSFK